MKHFFSCLLFYELQLSCQPLKKVLELFSCLSAHRNGLLMLYFLSVHEKGSYWKSCLSLSRVLLEIIPVCENGFRISCLSENGLTGNHACLWGGSYWKSCLSMRKNGLTGNHACRWERSYRKSCCLWGGFYRIPSCLSVRMVLLEIMPVCENSLTGNFFSCVSGLTGNHACFCDNGLNGNHACVCDNGLNGNHAFVCDNGLTGNHACLREWSYWKSCLCLWQWS